MTTIIPSIKIESTDISPSKPFADAQPGDIVLVSYHGVGWRRFRLSRVASTTASQVKTDKEVRYLKRDGREVGGSDFAVIISPESAQLVQAFTANAKRCAELTEFFASLYHGRISQELAETMYSTYAKAMA